VSALHPPLSGHHPHACRSCALRQGRCRPPAACRSSRAPPPPPHHVAPPRTGPPSSAPPPIAAFTSSHRPATSVRTPPPHLVRHTPRASSSPPPATRCHSAHRQPPRAPHVLCRAARGDHARACCRAGRSGMAGTGQQAEASGRKLARYRAPRFPSFYFLLKF
jgi:hypothetical protein